jgi:membrane protein
MLRLVSDRAAGAARTTWETLRLYVDDQALSWAGAIGLYLFLSVPPLMVASVYLAGAFVPTSQAEAFIVEQVAKYLPEGERFLEGVLATRPESPAAGPVAIGLLLVSGSRMFAAMTSAINVMWRRVDRLTFWRRQALRVGMVAATLVLMLVAAFGEAAIGAIASNGTADEAGVWLLDWQVLPTALLAAFLLVAYKLLPRDPVSWRHAAVGAVLATIGIRLGQAGMGLLARSDILSTPYGDMAGVALLATWALVVGIVLLFGAALVAVLDGKRSSDVEADKRFSRGS